MVAGEIPSQRLRSYTFGLAAAAGFLGAWLITFTAPYFINPVALNWGPRYGYIWFPSCIISAVWVYFYLPEVKGRTLEEIDAMVSKPEVEPETEAKLLTFLSVQREAASQEVQRLQNAGACCRRDCWKIKRRAQRR
jgi:nitrate/nitrite transporter NarK